MLEVVLGFSGGLVKHAVQDSQNMNSYNKVLPICALTSLSTIPPLYRDFNLEASHTSHLLVIILLGVVDDVEETELVDTLARRYHAKPVAELLLLEVLLRPVVIRLSANCCIHCPRARTFKL